MVKIEWEKKYEVGNIEIDSEHRVFVRIIQKIVRSVERKDFKHTERLVNEIYKYADFHFCSEENVMAEIDYPHMADHKKEHEKLLLDLRNMVAVLGTDNYSRPMEDLIHFLKDWFVGHTINVDKNLADFINKSS